MQSDAQLEVLDPISNESSMHHMKSQPARKVTFMTDSKSEFEFSGESEEEEETYQEAYEKLSDAINKIDQQFFKVISRHENEFVENYKHHMERVGAELRQLRNKALELESNAMKDDRITGLTVQIKWYKKEAMKLIKSYEETKQEVLNAKAKRMLLKQDNTFLRNQVKNQHKNNNKLQLSVKTQQEAKTKLQSGDQKELERAIGEEAAALPNAQFKMRPGEYVSYGHDFNQKDNRLDVPLEQFTADLLTSLARKSDDEIRCQYLNQQIKEAKEKNRKTKNL